MSGKKIATLIVGAILLLLVLTGFGRIIEIVDASNIVVKQALSGELEVWADAGPHFQNFATLETYQKSQQIVFGGDIVIDETSSMGKDHKDQPLDEETLQKLGQCLPIRFNDNGTGKLCGSISYDMPTDQATMAKIHTKFRSQEAVERRLILPALMKAAYNSGPMMSSRESAGDRRAELLETLREQATEGIFKVEAKEEQQEDLLAELVDAVEMSDAPVLDAQGIPVLNPDGTPKMEKKPKVVKKHPMTTVKVVRPKLAKNGTPEIAEPSAAKEFGIRLYNFTINRLIYDERVRMQIIAQQEATMAIQTAKVNSQRAEQDALTAKAQGEAQVAKVKASKDAEKQAAVTMAEQKRDTAKLDLEAADFEKQAAIKRAEGDAEARKLVMVADGALDKKLQAWTQAQKFWADAASKQPLVPSINMGGVSSATPGLEQFMSLMAAKSANDLALDLKVKTN